MCDKLSTGRLPERSPCHRSRAGGLRQRIELRQRHQPGRQLRRGTPAVELSIGTFGEFGYEDLLVDYHNLHPNVTIKPTRPVGRPVPPAAAAKLTSGSGLETWSPSEEGHLSDVLSKPQLLNNLEQIGPKDVTKDAGWTGSYDAARPRTAR